MTRVFANGCFDLLHPGHISLLRHCNGIGEVIVGLNSDESVRRLKGPSRPVLPEQHRKMALESCRFVDEVHLFDEDTPYRLISEIMPDFIVKGSEFRGQSVVGEDLAPVLFFEEVFDVSTSQIIDKIRSRT